MYSKTRYSRGIVATLASVAALPNPKLGETCFCSENGRVMTYDGELWMCDDFVKATNASGMSLVQGNLAIWQSGASNAIEVVTTDVLATFWAGVVVYSTAIGAPVALAYKGVYKVYIDPTKVPTTYNRLGFFVRQSSVMARGELATVVSSAGWFGWNVEIVPAGGLTKCLLRGRPELL